MTSVALRMAKHLNLSVFSRIHSPIPVSPFRMYSTTDAPPPPPPAQDPPQQRFDFRVLHKAILGNTGNVPDQNILRDGQNATVFTVGTPAMIDQKLLGTKDSQKPPQWHRIAVHNEYVRRGNVWSRELTIMQLRILRKTKKQKLSIKKRSMKRGIFSRENLNRLIHLKNTRKLSHFHGGLPITKMHRGRKGASYIPFLLNLETRLDVILTRLHFCETIGQARQLIRHRKVSVNGSSCDPKQPYHYTMSKDV